MNHRSCPTKRRIIQRRIQDTRYAREKEIMEKEKSSELGKQIAVELSNINEWPKMPTLSKEPAHNYPMSAIITLALIDEVQVKGSFQSKLDKACEDNNFQKFKYEINHDAAIMFVLNLCANPRIEPMSNDKSATEFRTLSQPMQAFGSQQSTQFYSSSQPMQTTQSRQPLRSLRYVRDMNKHRGAVTDADIDSDTYISDSNIKMKRRRISPK